MTLTVEHDQRRNTLRLITDKTVEHLEFDEANDLLVEVTDIVQKIEEAELKRDADEYGDMYRLRRE
ncbi:Hypothetical protein ROUS_37 [Brevibacterium phage Rousseau]|nr:Hypothetical protein ROUS_37 [Brevibacterium phage Rousseau]